MAARAPGLAVDLHEMRPVKGTPVHHTGDLAELVCSNSLRGNALDQAAGLLKEEMRRMGSLVIRVADEVKVPAGSALAVDRELFARRITQEVAALPGVTVHRVDLRHPGGSFVHRGHGALTSGPWPRTSPASWLGPPVLLRCGEPVCRRTPSTWSARFRASRYGRGGDDYVNCPLTRG